MSDSEASEFLAAMNTVSLFQPGEWCQFGIADFSTDVLIGDIGVHVEANEEEAEIGFTLSRQTQGLGLATEAVRGAIRLVLEHTPVGRVIATTDARNLPAIRLLERIGMRQVDTLKAVFRGEPCIEYVFAQSRNDSG